MIDAKNLLVELFVEELPPKALKKLGEAFASGLAAALQAQGLAPADAVVTPFASPRRLAAHITGVAAKAADRSVLHKLMPVAVALLGIGALDGTTHAFLHAPVEHLRTGSGSGGGGCGTSSDGGGGGGGGCGGCGGCGGGGD